MQQRLQNLAFVWTFGLAVLCHKECTAGVDTQCPIALIPAQPGVQVSSADGDTM